MAVPLVLGLKKPYLREPLTRSFCDTIMAETEHPHHITSHHITGGLSRKCFVYQRTDKDKSYFLALKKQFKAIFAQKGIFGKISALFCFLPV